MRTNVRQAAAMLHRISHVSNMNHLAYMKRIRDYLPMLDTLDNPPTRLRRLADDFAAACEAETAAFRDTRVRPDAALTRELKEADRHRDQLLGGLRSLCHGYAHDIYSPERQQAARLLLEVMKHQQLSANDLYLVEGVKLHAFIVRLDKSDEQRQAVQLLGLQPYVEALNRLNEQTEAIYDKRNDARSTFDPQQLQKARSVTDRCYAELIEMVNALAIVLLADDGTTPLDDFLNSLNAFVRYYKTQVLR